MMMRTVAAAVVAVVVASSVARGAWIWVEGEKPSRSAMNRHPWWYDQVKRDQLSGGDFISNYSKDKAGEAEYAFSATEAGPYEFWVRANPVQARLSYRLNGGPWTAIDLEKNQVGSTNIAADDKPDLRFIVWVKVGQVSLKKGGNTIGFRMDSPNSNHGYLDCFVLSNEAFEPQGIMKPGQVAAGAQKLAEENKGWFAFTPKGESFGPSSGFDLRPLNEKFAGEGGFIAVKGGQFVHGSTGEALRFWAVNGPSDDLKDRDSLRKNARLLAKYGVNMVRVHGGYFEENGNVDMAKVKRAIKIVEAMKEEGIYTHFSIYFPLWIKPKANSAFAAGYDGSKNPFASLYFNKDFQNVYRSWWKALLLTPSPTTGKPLIDEPAVAGAEIINEDSYFFWTFATANIPDEQLRILEAQFGDWLRKRYGSIDQAMEKWNNQRVPRDRPAEGRVSFRPLWNMFNEKTARERDTARFLLESQRGFYQQTYQFLHEIGFKGMITCSNWATASPQVFGPIEKYSYTVGDFLDRHGYFSCNHKGQFAAWSIRDGHTYSERSALRFEGGEPGKPRSFVHPVMDIHYDNKPSMISETTFNRPNRYRSEAPLFYAAYGALQDSDAIVHFALDSSTWAVKPGYFMQQWTLMSPAMMGQFPAAAMIYRKGLVSTGDTLVELNLRIDDLLDLKGTPMPQDAAFDELRLKDVPQGTTIRPGNVIDPLVHFAGRTHVSFTQQGGAPKLADLSRCIDRKQQTVLSSTSQLKLDYGKGIFTINAPAAQGVSGAIKDAGAAELKDLSITSDMELGHIVAVALDDQPLGSSKRILLQAMSEEKNSGFQTEAAAGSAKRIVKIGQDPYLVKEISGTVRLKRADAAKLKVTALDYNGYPTKQMGTADAIKLQPATMYYLITP